MNARKPLQKSFFGIFHAIESISCNQVLAKNFGEKLSFAEVP